MKIVGVEFWPVTMALREPYAIAYETVSQTVNIFIRLETKEGLVGYGCAAPDEGVCGESVDQSLTALNQSKDLLLGANPLRYAQILQDLNKTMKTASAAKAGVDMALFDLIGKRAGLPIYQMFGGFRTRIKTSVTIGILPMEKTLAVAKNFLDQGFLALKMKGGKDLEDDIARVAAVRKLVGPGFELRFDANQGYTVEQALAFVEAIRPWEIELFEQPTPKNQPGLLGQVTDQVHLPVMADESLLSLLDAFHIAKNGLADMVNIKLMKVGGLDEAFSINSVARAAGLECMVGCMDEAGLAIAAGLHFTLARPNVCYADLDGAMDLLEDPSAQAVILRKGYLYPTNKPGLGFDLEEPLKMVVS